jgi:thiol-disulfide isomerase/thioredoxin
MRRLAGSVMVLGLAVLVVRADDPAPKTSASFDALKKEYTDVVAKHRKELADAQQAVKDAKTDDDKKDAQKKLADVNKDIPGTKYAGRFLEFAQQNPKDPMVFEAVMNAFNMSHPANNRDVQQNNKDVHEKAIALLKSDFAAKPEIKQALRLVASTNDTAAEPLLREILAKNSDLRMQAHAAKALAVMTKKDGEKEELEKLLKGKYAEFFPDLSEGKPIPEVITQDLNGKEVKLSKLKGKVVVVDIWATWCPPCRAMIPHEREMVERLKDKPFDLVSISIDAKKETLADFLTKEPMPWTHWWAGNNSPWVEDWDVRFIPTTYVVDAKGVIRYKNLRDAKLEEAVNTLLKEMEEKEKK